MLERLTNWRNDNCADIANNDGANPTQQMMKIPTVITRLAQIEDILGEEYDIERLKEIVEADKNGTFVVLPFKVIGKTYTLHDFIGRPVFFARGSTEHELKGKNNENY